MTHSNVILQRLWRMFQALINLGSGLSLALAMLELILRVNSHLLVRGMAALGPLEAPLTVHEYDVRYSDADSIFWRPDLIRPITPAENHLEAHIQFSTDELGFRNPAPIPATVDVVVLGRSISLGAQNPSPWPEELRQQTGWTTLNLSQPGSGLDEKINAFEHYGLGHHPRWVVVEIQSSLDIFGYAPARSPAFILEGLPSPIIQFLTRPWIKGTLVPASEPLYPIALDVANRTLPFVCCIHYLDTLTVEQATLEASTDWQLFRQSLDQLIALAQAHRACVALLYAPMKPNIYFPLAQNLAQLEPVARTATPLRLNPEGRFEPQPGATVSPALLQSNAFVGRDIVARFAQKQNLAFVDPTTRMSESVLAGADPFMVYDSHWNSVGHAIVAQAVADTLAHSPCP